MTINISEVGIAVNPDSLDGAVEFDVPFAVRPINVSAIFPVDGVYAPSSHDGELDDDRWRYFSAGYTGQYGYAGPIMHPSEFLGGRLAEDILCEPGVYCVISDESGDDSEEANGWAVVKLREDVL